LISLNKNNILRVLASEAEKIEKDLEKKGFKVSDVN